MKKSLSNIIWLLFLIIIFTGCNASPKSTTQPTNQEKIDSQHETSQSLETTSEQGNTKKDFLINIGYREFNLNDEITERELILLADDGKSAVSLLRNAIFARYGYKFSDESYHEFFAEFEWYKPLYTDVSRNLREVDHKNLETIIEFEKNYFATLEIGSSEYKSELIGIWHSTPSVGSGYGARYHFFNNGDFIYHASEMDGETRVRTKKGVWTLNKGSLVLKINEVEEIVGGQKVSANGSITTNFQIIDGTLEKKELNYNEKIKVSSISKHNLLGKSMVKVNETPFWKYTDDPYEDDSSNTKEITSLIPEGWHLLEHAKTVRAEGDLNNDGIQDLAIVIEKTEEDESADTSRSLLIAFGNKDHSYSISIIADHVILGALEGGGWGDPFDGIEIDNGSVVVSDFGGSSERVYHKYRFRFQDNDWYLIGATRGWNHSIKEGSEMAFDTEDYNLLTGDYIFEKTNENGEVEITKGSSGKKELIKLKEFNPEDIFK